MDVTPQILYSHSIYGSSDNTNQAYTSASRALNYANGSTWQKAQNQFIGVIPYDIRYADSVGLFGAENYYIKVECNPTGTSTLGTFEEEGWESAAIDSTADDSDPYYVSAAIPQVPEGDEPFYQGARLLADELPDIGPDPFVSVDLKHFKSGNQYNDAWLDCRLYTRDREEHPYDKMYVRKGDHFYIGISARNTRNLPYDLSCLVGEEYRNLQSFSPEERRYIMRTISGVNYSYA